MDLDTAGRAFGAGEVDDADELRVLQARIAIFGDVVAGVEIRVRNADRLDEGIEKRLAIGEAIDRPPGFVHKTAGDDD